MPNDKAIKGMALDQTAFAQTVKESLRSVKEKVAAVRKTDSQLFVVSVVSPAASALLAAFVAAAGGNEVFKGAAAQSPDGGWKLACILVAAFGFIATVSGMFKKQFDDRLAQGNLCLGRLLMLDSDLTTQSRTSTDAAKEYGEIIKTFPDLVS